MNLCVAGSGFGECQRTTSGRVKQVILSHHAPPFNVRSPVGRIFDNSGLIKLKQPCSIPCRCCASRGRLTTRISFTRCSGDRPFDGLTPLPPRGLSLSVFLGVFNGARLGRMPPRPQLPAQECFDCNPEGNRLMTHVATVKEPRIVAAGEHDFIAVFQCSKVPSHRRREAFDPSGF